MTNPPSEDRLVLPPKWARHVMPRRGRDQAAPVELDAAALQDVERRIADNWAHIEQGIERNGAYRDAILAYLQGRFDPVGASALMHLMDATGTQTVAAADRLQHLDAWVARHGLGFAAAAVLESAAVYNRTYAKDDRSISDAHLDTYLEWVEPKGWRGAEPAAHRIRALLAAAGDEQYRVAVDTVAQFRTDPQRIIGAALLMPTEAAWVEAAVPAFTGYFERRRADDWMVWHIAADPRDLHLTQRRGLTNADERSLAPLIAGVGTGALPLLTNQIDVWFERLSKPARAALMTAIGLLPADEATAQLIDRLHRPGALTVAMATAERFPQRTLRAVALCAQDADDERRRLLGGLVGSSEAMRTALETADAETREAVDGLIATGDRAPEADIDALPPLLASPPWKAKRPKPVVVAGLEPEAATAVVWADEDERRLWAALREEDGDGGYDEQQVQRVLAHFEKSGEIHYPILFFAWARIEAAESLLDRWDGEAGYFQPEDLQRMLARFGDRVADRIVPLVKGRTALAEVLVPVRTLEAARLAAEWIARSKSLAPVAKRWFARHAEAAPHLLVPDALGGDKPARKAATAALRHLIAEHGAEPVAAAAKAYGEAAANAIDALIAADPLDPLDATIPKQAAWAAPALLPQVLLKGRAAALPAESVRHLLTVLALDSPEVPYAGVGAVAEACDAASLTAFSWAVFELWTAAGAPAKDSWAFSQLAHFADDDTVARLEALIRRWPGQGQHKRAVAGLERLGAIGTETALRALYAISRKVAFRPLKKEAGRQIDLVAARLGLSPEQLADRLVPDFGLGGGLVLDYGPRQFTVGFDERLVPCAIDGDGKRLARLPKPGKQDDAAVADEAYQRFAQLKRDVKKVAEEQVRRLERAMAAQRTWTGPQFLEFFADHPLLRHLARRLVWEAVTAEGALAFRIAEDGTYADVEEETVEIPETARIRLAHPAALGDALAAWTEVFADYEVLQPFEQLGRPVMAFTEEELRTGRLERFTGRSISVGRVFALTKAGWLTGPANNLWVEPGVHLPLPGGGYVVLVLESGFDAYLGTVDADQPDQAVKAVHLSSTVDYDASVAVREHPTAIDAVTASEVLRTLDRYTSPR
ncbi:DUF4132 domain-containing protein [Glycomyces artemisiae]|uniref:Uncharacterized protein DUF4132 n=1 Tax=Glycomyces artemisiae TaxID=1076443 RepID=A0A2T0UPB5_9ACTN|nr:DUF4132 domain-containing protein [Glycomyces artemisiae]PRY59760.1 uncharacterized protein DUF4132 [Glycomyces artemisiae]